MNYFSKNIKTDYGIDAPGIRLGMVLIALVGMVLLTLIKLLPPLWSDQAPYLFVFFKSLGSLAFFYGTLMASYMTWGSKVGKLRTRDQLLDSAGNLLKWTDISTAVDVGCGRGLMLCGAAKLVSNGRVIGFDIWSKKDQSQNHAEATLKNALSENVLERVQVETADARDLPLESGSVDLVMSHWVVHNIESQEEQNKALAEMWRVLRPGGVLLLADIANVNQYQAYFEELGAKNTSFNDGGVEARLMGFLSGGTYVPQTLVLQRA